MKTSRYVRKPFYVDAVQVTKENMEEVAKWCGGDIQHDLNGIGFIKALQHRSKTIPKTRAFVGDWVLSSKIGFRVYTNGAFEKSFEDSDGEWSESFDEALNKVKGGFNG